MFAPGKAFLREPTPASVVFVAIRLTRSYPVRTLRCNRSSSSASRNDKPGIPLDAISPASARMSREFPGFTDHDSHLGMTTGFAEGVRPISSVILSASRTTCTVRDSLEFNVQPPVAGNLVLPSFPLQPNADIARATATTTGATIRRIARISTLYCFSFPVILSSA